MASPIKSSAAGAPGWLRQLAAPHWTALFFVLTAAGALAIIEQWLSATLLMALPFALLVINLGAAIAVLPRFRRDLPLLVFHLCLLALIALFCWSRLTYLDATTAITQGDRFDGVTVAMERGPLHTGNIRQLQFRNEGFTESYPNRYRVTANRVSWREGSGPWQTAVIGGSHPLVLGQYRIYTKLHRGYTARFRWQGDNGAVSMGRVQFNTNEAMAPANNWALPDGTPIWAMLELPEAADYRRERPVTPVANLNVDQLDYTLVLRTSDDSRYTAQRGESLRLDNGTLYLDQLQAWMGYRIVYDPARPWIMATVVAGVLSLVWFYSRQLRGKHGWDSDR